MEMFIALIVVTVSWVHNISKLIKLHTLNRGTFLYTIILQYIFKNKKPNESEVNTQQRKATNPKGGSLKK